MTIIKAAGRTLGVGELREALTWLDDNAEVIAHGTLLMRAEAGMCTLELDGGIETDHDALDAFRDLLERIAAGGMKLAEARKLAAELISDYPA